jgi:hypothetical protein
MPPVDSGAHSGYSSWEAGMLGVYLTFRGFKPSSITVDW